MKIGIKIVQFRDGYYGAKKRGCFGVWRYLVCDSDRYGTYYSWGKTTPRRNEFDRFYSKQDLVDKLRLIYHEHREDKKYEEVL